MHPSRTDWLTVCSQGGWAGFLDQDASDEDDEDDESEGFAPSDDSDAGSGGDASADSDDESLIDEDDEDSDAVRHRRLPLRSGCRQSMPFSPPLSCLSPLTLASCA